MAQRICAVPGCERKHCSRGFCTLHYQRWRSTGDPGEAEARRWGRSQQDVVGYVRLHHRISETRGRASDHLCVDCGEQAAQWSYRNSCPEELPSEYGEYCLHVEHYDPRCVSCHRKFDGIAPSEEARRRRYMPV